MNIEKERAMKQQEVDLAISKASAGGRSLLERYRQIRTVTERLTTPLATEDCVVQTSTECSPVKWHLAHTTWFFETFVLAPNDSSYHLFHPTYGYLFNSYYNSIGERTPRPARGMMSRPVMAEVMEYRQHVNRGMEHLLNRDVDDSLAAIIELGLNHEQQHQELIVTDVKTVLGMNPLRPVYQAREIISSHVLPLSFTSFDEALIECGAVERPATDPSFYFDNEGPRHRQYIERFELANRLVTNGEYKEFIADNGYRTPTLWLSDGWGRCLEEKWQAPKYWELGDDGTWWNMTLQGYRPVEDSEPVTHISHFEADAYATWHGSRLPTEFEWEHASIGQFASGNLQDRANFHPIPAPNGSGIQQLFGDVWEWTRSAYLPYPGFRPVEGAIGEYNGKFMSNQIVLRGGSCLTPADHVRPTYRNFFPPESRWQFSGIRLAK